MFLEGAVEARSVGLLETSAILSIRLRSGLRLRLHSGLRQSGSVCDAVGLWHPSAALRTDSEAVPLRFEEALRGVVRLAFCERMSQK
jgi:hypothetical protein